MNRLYRISITLGLIPLITGIFIFVLWFYTKSEDLVAIGTLTIIAGLITVTVAAFCLILYLARGILQKASAKSLLRKALLPGGIIISNFLVCHFIIALVAALPTSEIRERFTGINDITQKEKLILNKEEEKNTATMNVRIRLIIQGNLDGRAIIYISHNGPNKQKYEIGPGEINFGLSQDWYDRECLLEYEPIDVKSGGLAVQYLLE